MLSIWVAKCLYELVDASLLEPFDIVLYLFVQWKFILIEVQIVARRNDYQLIIIKELSCSYLFRELRIFSRGLLCHLITLL